jgi:ABC-type branched-subunit amino acid transport system substrate-binding protein
MTGQLADPGTDLANAALLAVEEINKNGGVNGRMLKGIVEDDACDAQQAVQAAQKLLTQNIVAIVGGYCSGASIPQGDVLRRNGNLPFLGAAASSPKLTEQGYDNVFRLSNRSDNEGAIIAAYLKDILKIQKVAIVHDNTTYGKSASDTVNSTAKGLGLDVVYLDAITPGQKDYTSTLTKVKTTGAEVMVFLGYYPEFALMVNELARLRPGYKLVGAGGTVDPSTIKVAGDALTSSDVSQIADQVSAFTNNPQARAFKAKYRAKYGREPGAYSVYEWDGVHLLAQAIKNANGSTKAADINRELHKISYTGVTRQPIEFDSKGDPTAGAYLAVRVGGSPLDYQVIAVYSNKKWNLGSQ